MCFNPRTPCGVRLFSGAVKGDKAAFQSTHSLRSATFFYFVYNILNDKFQSTHSLRSATALRETFNGNGLVSIHALLAECDNELALFAGAGGGFNPRTPCGVRRLVRFGEFSTNAFQSTHSLRSATMIVSVSPAVVTVSIHALLAECDNPIVAHIKTFV